MKVHNCATCFGIGHVCPTWVPLTLSNVSCNWTVVCWLWPVLLLQMSQLQEGYVQTPESTTLLTLLQPGTREAASNPIVIILSVVTGAVMLFGLANYALYVFAHKNKPKKAGKRVSHAYHKAAMLNQSDLCCNHVWEVRTALQISKKKQRREGLRNGSSSAGKWSLYNITPVVSNFSERVSMYKWTSEALKQVSGRNMNVHYWRSCLFANRCRSQKQVFCFRLGSQVP